MVMAATPGPAHGPMPSSRRTVSRGTKGGRAGAGYARHGFRINFFINRPGAGAQPKWITNQQMLANIVKLAVWRIQSPDFKRSRLMNPIIAKYIPFFNLGNYSAKEQKFFKKVHPQPGGNLIRSGHAVVAGNEQTGDILVEFAWATPYLGYLIRHGVSRQKGTLVNFWPEIRKTGYLQTSIRNVLNQVLQSAYSSMGNDRTQADIRSTVGRWWSYQALGDF